MPKKTLTDRFLAGARAANYFDTTVRGLCFRVTPAGAKIWSFVYRVKGGGPQWMKVGSYPALTLVQARAAAKGLRRLVDVGRDPIAETRAAAATAAAPPTPVAPILTVRTFAKTFITFQKGRKQTWHEDELKIKKYILPAWGELPIASITRTMIAALLSDIAAQGLTVGVNRVQMVISRMLAIALSEGHIDANPASRMEKRFAEVVRERVLTDDEIRALHAELVARPSEAADVVWLRLLLGQRGGETEGMLWKELDLEARTWFLNGVRTKNGRPHLIWLPESAVAILTRARGRVPVKTPHVFPSMSASITADERALYGVAATFENFDWRDLRRTFSTGLGDLGIEDGVIDRLLNHAAATISRKHYNHAKYLPEKQVALAAWDRELARILTNKPKTSRVLVMPSR